MKKLFFFSVLSVFILSSCFCPQYVQNSENDEASFGWNRGDIAASARANFFNSSQGDDKETNFKINPCVGYLFNDNFEAGLSAKYASDKIEQVSFEEKSNTFAVGPYARWYCAPKKRFSPYLETELRYSTTNFKTFDYKQNGLDVSAGFGFNYWLTPRLTLNVGYAGLEYQNLNDTRDGVDNLSSFRARLNSKNLRFGAALKL